MLMLLPSLGSTIAGWTSAAALKTVPDCDVRDTIYIFPEFSVCWKIFGRYTHLTTPAHTQHSELLDLGRIFLDSLYKLRYFVGSLRWLCRALKESTQLLALLWGIRWVPIKLSGLAIEKVRYINLVLVVLVIGVR